MCRKPETKGCRAADGVTLVHSALGAGEPAVVFVHGGLADRTFWDAMLLSPGGYDNAAPARRVAAPIRTISGDLYPTEVEGARRVNADFDAVIMPHGGHYLMLERPEEFGRHLALIIGEFSRPPDAASGRPTNA